MKEIKFKKLHPDAVLPEHSTEGDAGLDLTVIEIETIKHPFNVNGLQTRHKFGIAVEIPHGYVGLVFPRSSVFDKAERLSNCVGVIDSGYRGELTAVFDIITKTEGYKVKDRSAQLVIVPYVNVHSVWAKELTKSVRGTNGYGSTGS